MTFSDHVATGNTTLCYCWIITRRDGFVLGVTDHDEDVVLNGTTCVATVGMVTSTISTATGLDPDDAEVTGIVDNDLITEEDVRAGLYDDATADLYHVNWEDPTQFRRIISGTLGKSTEADSGVFNVELLSVKNILLQAIGRTYQRTCDTKLGSPACGVNLSDPAFTGNATVTAIDGAVMTVSGIGGFDNGWFTLGLLVTATGYEAHVKNHNIDSIELWREPDVTITPGDVVQLVAGCKQDIGTCRDKFNNIENFQGFNLIPGNDKLNEYPLANSGTYDGESIFN